MIAELRKAYHSILCRDFIAGGEWRARYPERDPEEVIEIRFPGAFAASMLRDKVANAIVDLYAVQYDGQSALGADSLTARYGPEFCLLVQRRIADVAEAFDIDLNSSGFDENVRVEVLIRRNSSLLLGLRADAFRSGVAWTGSQGTREGLDFTRALWAAAKHSFPHATPSRRATTLPVESLESLFSLSDPDVIGVWSEDELRSMPFFSEGALKFAFGDEVGPILRERVLRLAESIAFAVDDVETKARAMHGDSFQSSVDLSARIGGRNSHLRTGLVEWSVGHAGAETKARLRKAFPHCAVVMRMSDQRPVSVEFARPSKDGLMVAYAVNSRDPMRIRYATWDWNRAQVIPVDYQV